MQTFQSLIERSAGRCVLVIGDTIVDQYIWAKADRVSPEAPVLVLRAERRESSLGGSAGVAQLLRGFGVATSLASVVGADDSGSIARRLLNEKDIEHDLLINDIHRPTTTKERIMGRSPHRQPHQIVRVDWESQRPLDNNIANVLMASVLSRLKEFACVTISDYGKGVCTPRLLSAVLQRCRENSIPTIVDPTSRGPLDVYRGVSVLKLNRLQAEHALGRLLVSHHDVLDGAANLRSNLRCEAVAVTLEEDGIALATSDAVELFRTTAVKVCDVTGAGDTVQAVFALGLASRADLRLITSVANIAAGIQVGSTGVCEISPSDIDCRLSAKSSRRNCKIVELEALANICHDARRTARRIVFTNGCFDLLHAGHIQYLHEAADCGDLLIVALNSDASVRRQKGATRPIITASQRAAILSSLSCVDYVIIFDDDTPHALLQSLQPDILVKGGDYALSGVVGAEIVESYGGEIKVLSHTIGISSTSIVNQIVRSSNA